MASINDATGDEMKSRTSNNEYRSGWDRIFGKKDKKEIEEVKDTDTAPEHTDKTSTD